MRLAQLIAMNLLLASVVALPACTGAAADGAPGEKSGTGAGSGKEKEDGGMLFPFGLGKKKTELVAKGDALPGREKAMPVPERHEVNGNPLRGLPAGMEEAFFGMGCFWGAERKFWQTEGVYSTAVGYQGGYTPNPTYEEVCSGRTGHAETVRVVYDPKKVSFETLLKVFWESHDPTQGMRQGNDVGTQYRSAIYVTTPAQKRAAEASRAAFEPRLAAAGFGKITTEVADAPPFYYAEGYHQQYLHKNPGGYCGLGGTGVSCPVGTGVAK